MIAIAKTKEITPAEHARLDTFVKEVHTIAINTEGRQEAGDTRVSKTLTGIQTVLLHRMFGGAIELGSAGEEHSADLAKLEELGLARSRILPFTDEEGGSTYIQYSMTDRGRRVARFTPLTTEARREMAERPEIKGVSESLNKPQAELLVSMLEDSPVSLERYRNHQRRRAAVELEAMGLVRLDRRQERDVENGTHAPRYHLTEKGREVARITPFIPERPRPE